LAIAQSIDLSRPSTRAAATAGGHTLLPQPHDRAQRVPPVDDAGAVDGLA
jgi:hypothetical protein